MVFPGHKYILFTAFLTFISPVTLGSTPPSISNSTNASGEKLAQAVYDQATGTDSSSRVVMQLSRKGKKPKQRILYSYGKDKGNGERWTLLRFIKPNDVARTGLLTKDYAGDDSDQWLYLPALDRVRRISSSRRGGRFVGSDYQYEDLTDREVNMDHHRIIGEEKVSGIKCTLLESTPVKKSNSIYSKRVSCIHPKIFVPLRIDYYNGKKKKPTKQLKARKIKKVQGYWTIFDSTMYNLKTGHSTKLITTDIKYDQGIPDNLFSQRGLSDDSREKMYRPQGEKLKEYKK